MSDRYEYEAIRAAAIAPGATQGEIDRLGEWFDRYGSMYWNGEYYDADGYRVFPVIEWDDESDTGNTVGYVIK